MTQKLSKPWIIAGDYNALLSKEHKHIHRELEPLSEGIPSTTFQEIESFKEHILPHGKLAEPENGYSFFPDGVSKRKGHGFTLDYVLTSRTTSSEEKEWAGKVYTKPASSRHDHQILGGNFVIRTNPKSQ